MFPLWYRLWFLKIRYRTDPCYGITKLNIDRPFGFEYCLFFFLFFLFIRQKEKTCDSSLFIRTIKRYKTLIIYRHASSGGISIHDHYSTDKVLFVQIGRRVRLVLFFLDAIVFRPRIGDANRFRFIMSHDDGVQIVRATRAHGFNQRVDRSVCAKTRTDCNGYYLLALRWR